jgi:hypothetical protein
VSRNAGEFEIKLRELLANYKRAQERLRANRHRFTQDSTAIPAGVGDALLTENLEAHTRTYLVDGIFAALGWTMSLGQDPVGQLLIEQPIRALRASTVKFMDYLGVEGNTDRPLLIVETKRPAARLPHYDGRPPMYETAGAYADLLAKGLSDPERLSADWPEWIDQVGGYARAVFARCQEWPRRVVITNGEWMIIFEDAASAFGTAEQVDPKGIVVLPRLSPAHETAGLVFQSIAYGQLVSNTEFRTPAELPFYLRAAAVDGVLHGLRVFAGEKRGHSKIEPTIYVTPLLFLRTVQGAWFKVHEESADHEFEIPYNKESVVTHLRQVDSAASALLFNVNHHLSAQMVPTELEQHCSNPDRLRELIPFVRRTESEFEVVTGRRTHYLLEQPRLANCPFHHWAHSLEAGQAATERAILRRSVSPKSFFSTGEDHHCSHLAVLTIKSQPLSEEFSSRPGIPMGSAGRAFCEIFPLDHHLCCQACVFHDVCSRSEAFRLPCHRVMP